MQKRFSSFPSFLGTALAFALAAGDALFSELKAWRKWYFFRRPALMGLTLYCLLLLTIKSRGWLDKIPAHDPAQWNGQRVRMTGLVAAHPDPKPKGCQVLLDVETVATLDEDDFTFRSVSGLVLIQVSGATSVLAAPGDRLTVRGRLQPPKAARTPGAFDYGDYLEAHGIHSVMFTSFRSVDNLGDAGQYRLLRWGWRLQDNAVRLFYAHLEPEEAAVLSGLAVGRRPRFHPKIRKIFVESGTMHILVASGSNVAFVIGLGYLFLRLFRLPRRWALLMSLPGVWTYVLLAGADPPIFRAGVMATIGVLSYAMAREDRGYQTLALAALALLIPSPASLFDVGFQMSFISVFGLLHFLPGINRHWALRNAGLRWLAYLVCATFTAQLWLLPISLTVFRRLFLVGLVSNIIILPLAAGGLSAGLGLLLLDRFVSQFGLGVNLLQSMAALTQSYIHLIIVLVRFFAEYPRSSLWVSPPHWMWIVPFYAGCLSVTGLRSSWLCRFLFGGALAALLAMLGLNAMARGRPPAFQMSWLDVGRTCAVLIETPQGKNILINPGLLEPMDTTERILMPFLAERGIRVLNAVVVTRWDEKISASVEALRQSMGVQTLLRCDQALPKPFLCGDLTLETVATSNAFKVEPPLLIRQGNAAVVLAQILPLESQEALLRLGLKKLDLLQARFSEKLLWREEFVQRLQPTILVETGFKSARRPSSPPWPDRMIVTPQEAGYWLWRKGDSRPAFK